LDDITGGSKLISAAAYLNDLKENDQLPGVRPQDHWTFRSFPIRTVAKDSDIYQLYIRATVESQKGNIYWYRVIYKAEPAHWNLVEAWEIDKIGNKKQLELISRSQ